MARIYAHRGASIEHPENTLLAFSRAIDLGVYGVELDVHLSSDEVPVVIHDERVDRTTNGTGAVAELPLAELQLLDAGDGTRIPSLEEVLDLVGAAVHVDIEVKAAAAADAVLAVTARRPALRYAVSSFDHTVLEHVKSRTSNVEVWPLTIGASDQAIAVAHDLGSSYLAMHEQFVNAEILDYLRGRSIEAWVWTVNDPARARELATMGVAGICTDDPGGLQSLLPG